MFFNKKLIKFVLLIIFILPNTSFSNEYTCNCKSLNMSGWSMKGSDKSEKNSKDCSHLPNVIIDYVEGFFSITFPKINKTFNLDIKNDEKKYVTASEKRDSKNFKKIHFDKKKKVLRFSASTFIQTSAISVPKANLYSEAFTLSSKTNAKFQCK